MEYAEGCCGCYIRDAERENGRMSCSKGGGPVFDLLNNPKVPYQPTLTCGCIGNVALIELALYRSTIPGFESRKNCQLMMCALEKVIWTWTEPERFVAMT